MGVAVFASGSGSNAQAILDRETLLGRGGASPWRTRLVISDREEAGALERARRAGVETRVIPVKGRAPGEVETETLDALRGAGVGLVLLAGYLRLVPPGVVAAWPRRILNIHPALLPSFGGKGMYGRRVHEAVIASGARVSGPTVHFVNERYDEGAMVAQWPVPVRPDDTAETLAARVLRVEHVLYPAVVEHVSRALARGDEPGPYAPPGEAFALVDDLSVTAFETRSPGRPGTP